MLPKFVCKNDLHMSGHVFSFLKLYSNFRNMSIKCSDLWDEPADLLTVQMCSFDFDICGHAFSFFVLNFIDISDLYVNEVESFVSC